MIGCLLRMMIFCVFQIPVLTFSSDFSSRSKNQNVAVLEMYQLKTRNCAFDLLAKKKGHVVIDDLLEDRSLFTEKSDAKGAALMPYFHCLQVSAHKYCPGAWTESVLDTDPAMSAAVDVRRYDYFHPIYYSLAFAANTNATNPPRPRTLHFCLGTEFNVIEGFVSIGTEKSHYALQALKILKTIKFD